MCYKITVGSGIEMIDPHILNVKEKLEDVVDVPMPFPKRDEMLSNKELNDWRENAKILYASRSINGKAMKMWAHANGKMRIFIGDEMIYDGDDVNEAIDMYNLQLL